MGCGARVEHAAKRRHILRKWLTGGRPCRFLQMTEEQRLREHKHIVAAKVGIRFFTGDQKYVPIGEPLTTIEVNLLFVEPNSTGIVGVRIAMKISQDRQVDTE